MDSNLGSIPVIEGNPMNLDLTRRAARGASPVIVMPVEHDPFLKRAEQVKAYLCEVNTAPR